MHETLTFNPAETFVHVQPIMVERYASESQYINGRAEEMRIGSTALILKETIECEFSGKVIDRIYTSLVPALNALNSDELRDAYLYLWSLRSGKERKSWFATDMSEASFGISPFEKWAKKAKWLLIGQWKMKHYLSLQNKGFNKADREGIAQNCAPVFL